MASCVRNICTKNYQNLIIGLQVTVENVGDAFLGHSVVISIFVLLLFIVQIVRWDELNYC